MSILKSLGQIGVAKAVIPHMIYKNTGGSSAIEKIGYNSLSEELHILFRKNGRYPEYIFGGIDKKTAQNFMLARSPGSFYNNRIKGNKSFKVNRAFGSFTLGAIGRRARNFFNRK